MLELLGAPTLSISLSTWGSEIRILSAATMTNEFQFHPAGRATSVQSWGRHTPPFLLLTARRACATVRFSSPTSIHPEKPFCREPLHDHGRACSRLFAICGKGYRAPPDHKFLLEKIWRNSRIRVSAIRA